jgi:hypothetical protein
MKNIDRYFIVFRDSSPMDHIIVVIGATTSLKNNFPIYLPMVRMSEDSVGP